MRRALSPLAVIGLMVLAACNGSLLESPLVFSTSWVSDDSGWVLAADAGCSSTCQAVLFSTEDGGTTWKQVEGAHPRLELDRSAVELEPHLRFVDERNGWMVTPDLWSTHDGGATWTRVDLDGRVLGLEAADGRVHAAVLSPAGVRLWTSSADVDDFTASPLVLPAGAGPEPRVDLVLADDRGWASVSNVDSSSVSALSDGVWTESPFPCRGPDGVVGRLAASSADDVVALCEERSPTEPGFALYASDDGGRTFPDELTLPEGASRAVSGLARPADASLVIATRPEEPRTTATVASPDDGATWSDPVDLAEGVLDDLVFSSPDRGVAVIEDRMFQSADAGLTWTEVVLPGT